MKTTITILFTLIALFANAQITNENLVGEWGIGFLDNRDMFYQRSIHFFENKKWIENYAYGDDKSDETIGKFEILDPNKTIKLKYNNGSAFLEWKILSQTENTIEVEETKHQIGTGRSVKTGKLILHRVAEPKFKKYAGTWKRITEIMPPNYCAKATTRGDVLIISDDAIHTYQSENKIDVSKNYNFTRFELNKDSLKIYVMPNNTKKYYILYTKQK